MKDIFPFIRDNFAEFYILIKNTVVISFDFYGIELNYTILDCLAGLYVSSVVCYLFGFVLNDDVHDNGFDYSDDYLNFF